MASLTRTMLLRGPAQRALSSSSSRASLLPLLRPLSTTTALRATVGNAPPMEPHKQRPSNAEMGVGEIEGADFRIQPMRRVGEDDRTMRARLVYQSRKRGTLESDLLLSTFADTYLPTMSRERMAQYDMFLDENDWDIYYWATQEAPSPVADAVSSNNNTSSISSSSTSTQTQPTTTTDTSSPTYGSGAEAATAESHHSTAATSTGGQAREADYNDTKANPGANAVAAAAAASEEPYRKPGEGEWAQTVGTFKPAYRPVPVRWRDSEVLALLREHVKRRASQEGGMAFMPALQS
ncbi:Uu.00g106380.m01.CDS01 [Anthostomella pinea]|uniref:Succinate dehydrogenase assembly factor 2, mitochondrial n=1 Tax=Anthostomella pinea TaxID=933095 RepID=A0AAI8VEM3_9PEZI|nr:Uu.00g106380.m01.CDS01 [Anthostomella pinea]